MREKIALFDIDGTLADYFGQLASDMEKIRAPGEPECLTPWEDDAPDYIRARTDLIKRQPGWWLNLKKLQLGWDILEIAKEIGFEIMILSKGPRSKDAAWAEKVKWCMNHGLEEVTVTTDKALVYGRVLVDDYPVYVKGWLKHRPRGLVVMPKNNQNANYSHPNVIHYDGDNLNFIRQRMQEAYDRE